MINRSRSENMRVLNIFVEHVIEEAELVKEKVGEQIGYISGLEELKGDGIDDVNNDEGEKENNSDYGTNINDFREARDNKPNMYDDVVSSGFADA